MIIWRGWGIIAVLYVLAALLASGALSAVVPRSFGPLAFGVMLVVAAVATWFTGIAMNRTRPQRQVDAWLQGRRAQLDDLVVSGKFSLGPGQPQPASVEEARAMSDALLAKEAQELTKGALNTHSLFWIPMQYFAFIWGAIGVLTIIIGISIAAK